MSDEKTVRDGFLVAAANQVSSGDPPETKVAFERLMAEGHSESETLQLIGAALRVEMSRMIAESRPFDNARYAELLRNLPRLETGTKP